MGPDVRKIREKLTAWSGVISLGLALVIGGSYFVQVRQESERTACQAQYNAAFAKNLALRSESSNARLDALDAWLAGFLALIPASPDERTPEETERAREQFFDLSRTYAAAVMQNAKTREEHPLPAIPDC
jgi:hypothetical protein